MFGFSRKKMKLGRLKLHLGDASQGARSPARVSRRLSQANGENVGYAVGSSGYSDDPENHCSSSLLDLEKSGLKNINNWVVLSTEGSKPPPRFLHAATVVGSKMVVFGGDSGERLLNDTWILSLDKLRWATAAPKAYLSPAGLPLKIPAFRGHCLVPWGRTLLLVGGEADVDEERLSVWSFDIETECWSSVDSKGDIPVARRGHVVIRAGPFMILFGGEDLKGRKLNDLHMFDLKSLTWLPLHYTGAGPCPRSNHIAALYDDKVLLVFGGQSKSKFLNDLHSLDFETMVWSRIKIRGHHPSPRAGCRGALCGNKWYIVGGGSKKKRYAETLCFDILSHECYTSVASPATSITMSKGFSLVSLNHKEKSFLIAFGGSKKEPSNQVEVLVMAKREHSMSWRCASDIDPSLFENYPPNSIELSSHLASDVSVHTVSSFGRQSLASAMELNTSGRKSLSDSPIDQNSVPGSVSLQRQFDHEEGRNTLRVSQISIADEKFKTCVGSVTEKNASCKATEQRTKQLERPAKMQISEILPSNDEVQLEAETPITYTTEIDRITLDSQETQGASTSRVELDPVNVQNPLEMKIASIQRKNIVLEQKLAAMSANCEATERNLNLVINGKKEMERKLFDSQKEVEVLKEKLSSLELAQEEANNLSNLMHSDNVRLEHDIAFLKAVLDDTQKELHSTRGVLAGERARAFQLQVEVFHLKQRLQTMENRAPTPRKRYHV